MTFTVYIEGQALSDGVSVFPFSFGQLLDERLDEAYLHITKSATPSYKPTTEVRIDLREGNTVVKQFYFVIAKDNAYELPVGSGKYRHDLHLIERTKLLEGIYCQSINFTNSIGNNYTANANYAEPINDAGNYVYVIAGGVPFSRPFLPVSLDLYKTPFSASSLTLQSIRDVAEQISNLPLASWDANSSNRTQLVYNNGTGTVTVTDFDDAPTVSVSSSLFVEYTIFTVLEIVDPTEGTVRNFEGFKFSYNLQRVDNTLPLKPITVTDCINRVLDLAEPRFGYATADAPRFKLNAAQAAEFDKIPAPEFTMTQCTLREQLKIIGGNIHGEPRLFYNNEIYFDMYGNPEDSTEINASTPHVYRGTTHDIAQYCTQIDTSASNIVNALNYAQGVVFSPSAKNSKSIRTESVNIRVNEDNGYGETDLAIYDIAKVYGGVYGDNGQFEIGLTDITPYIFTGTAYRALSAFGGGYPHAKSYALYYDIGQKGIRGLFFKEESVKSTLYPYLEYYSIVNILAAALGWTPSAVRDKIGADYTKIVLRVSYVPIYNTRFSHGKQGVEDGTEYTQIYNQSENIIETRYFGENVKGVAARLGNVEQTRTYIFNTFSQIPKVGELINVGTEDNPDEYAISAVNTEVLPNYYKTTVALTKDFNRISSYVGISSNKRVYEVSEYEAYLRNILLKEYAVVGRRPRNGYRYTPGIFRHAYGIASAFAPTIKDGSDRSIKPISSVWAWGGTYQNPYQNGTQTGKAPLPLVSLPVISSAFGNSLVFSWGYKDNYSAGTRLFEAERGGVSGLWQMDVAYGDTYGKMYFYNFFLLTAEEESALGMDFSTSAPFVDTQDFFTPRLQSKIKTLSTLPYRIRKDSREVLTFNFEVEFKSNVKNLTIGSALASASRLVTTSGSANAVFYALPQKVGKFARTYDGEGYLFANILTNVSASGGVVQIELPSGWQTAPAFVIATQIRNGTPYQVQDEQGEVRTYTPHTGGEILLACNNPAALYSELGGNVIYINLSKSQKEDTIQ